MSSGKRNRRGLLSRRSTLRGTGAALGAIGVGCGDDAGDPQGSTGTETTGSGTDGSGVVDPSTTGSSSTAADSTGGTDSGSTTSGSSGSDGSSGSSGSSGTTGAEVDECGDDNMGYSPEELLASVDTIVVVMMQNRSLDHYFGSAGFLERWNIDGLTGDESNPRIDGSPVGVFPLANLTPASPPHAWDDCHLQWNLGANDGFVTVHEQVNPSSFDEVMGYHVRDQLPVLYALADNYTLFDSWHASVMGGNWPNRFYLHAGTSNGQQQDQPEPGLTTIWDILADAGISHANYYSDVAWIWGALLEPAAPFTSPVDEFFDAAAAGTLPAFSIIDPNFGLLPGGEGGNDDHPGHDITLGQVFLGSVYQALAQSPQWDNCLVVFAYALGGGFYDHVNPPTTSDPLQDFQQLGHRVPGLVIGPRVRRGCVDNTTVDHVSVLATATRRWSLPPLTERVEAAPDLSTAINPALLDDPQPPAPIPMLSVSVSDVLTGRQPGDERLATLIRSGEVPVPFGRRHPNAGREIALRMLDRAAKLGVVRLRP